MIRDREYASSLAPHMAGLVAVKRSCGFDYSAVAYTLARLDAFCVNAGFSDGSVTVGLADAWAQAVPSEGADSRSSRISALRQLALYERSLGIDAYVPRGFSSRERSVTYIPTPAETRSLFAAIDAYDDDRWPYMADGYRVAFRLMRCCGMRISECAAMPFAGVDANAGTLTVRHSKGAKDRLVYMADDMAAMVESHMHGLRRTLGFWPDWLFPGKDPSKHILKNTFCMKFAQFWSQVPESAKRNKRPTPHSLRHAFVVDRMNRWMEEGANLPQMMPYLSSYLGHSGPNETFYYYHQVEEAADIVRAHDAVSARVIPEVVPYEA